MNWDLAIWATGTVCALLAIIFGGRRLGRGASNVTENVDPNAALTDAMDDFRRRLAQSERDHTRAKADIATLKADLSDERHRSDEQDQQIAALHIENRQQREEMSLMRRMLEGWEAWYRILLSQWADHRMKDSPPEKPQPVTDPPVVP